MAKTKTKAPHDVLSAMDAGPHEVNLKDIPLYRGMLKVMFEEAKVHYESGKDTALAYYRTHSNFVTKLKAMGLQVSSRKIDPQRAKALGLVPTKRGPCEIFVRYPGPAKSAPAKSKRKAA